MITVNRDVEVLMLGGLQETRKIDKSSSRFYTGSESQEESLSGPRSQSEAIRGKSSATAIWAETQVMG